MNIETLRIPVADLVYGMHVVKLDRPWLDTPFKLQGFRIQGSKDLELLRQYCRYVYIDVARGVRPPAGAGVRVTLTEDGEIVGTAGFIGGAPRRKEKRKPEQTELPPPAVTYEVESSFDDELPIALEAVQRTKEAVRNLMNQMSGSTSRKLLAPVREAAGELEQSVLRNPDPAMLIRALRSDESFSFRHCVDSAILGIALCRALGFKRQQIHELTMGVLLADIGKSRLPRQLLGSSRRLTVQETAVVQQHVRIGVEMAEALDGLSSGSIEVIAAHHERFNGSGYPAGLRGGEISVNARIAGLVDAFDAITSERAYSEPILMHEAIQEMYAATVDVFQRELVEKLIHVMGTYPIGCMSELSDGSIALIIAQNPSRRLLPRVINLTNAAMAPLTTPEWRDLAGESGAGLSVRTIIDPGLYSVEQPAISMLTG